MLTAYFKLTTADIYNIGQTDGIGYSGLSKPIIVDGVAYRINQIADYDALSNDTTKVELIKIIKLV
jgi:hypothetical protein